MVRRNWRRALGVCVASAGALVAAACVTPIDKILADPSHYRNHDVEVVGTVRDSFSVADRGAYRIADGTGQLWVVSDRGVPRDGARVKVKGTIREGIDLGRLAGRLNLPPGVGAGVVLVESEHRAER